MYVSDPEFEDIREGLKDMFCEIVQLVDFLVDQGKRDEIPEKVLDLLVSPRFLWITLFAIIESKGMIEEDLRKGELDLMEKDRMRWRGFLQEWANINRRSPSSWRKMQERNL
jgi:hypothetical protein